MRPTKGSKRKGPEPDSEADDDDDNYSDDNECGDEEQAESQAEPRAEAACIGSGGDCLVAAASDFEEHINLVLDALGASSERLHSLRGSFMAASLFLAWCCLSYTFTLTGAR